MEKRKKVMTIITTIMLVVCANCVPVLDVLSFWVCGLYASILLVLNILPIVTYKGPKSTLLRFCAHGNVCLVAMCMSIPFTVILQSIAIIVYLPDNKWWALASVVTALVVTAVVS